MSNERGVSMMVEYLILAGILTVFVAVATLVLEDTLKRSQVSKVVENQFSDVASQISAQIVDMAALYPKNGSLKARVYMPSAIGDVKYTVGFDEINGSRYIFISSDRGEFKKYLSLGSFASLRFEDMSGITHSLQERHELMFSSAAIIYPKAVLKIRPSAIIEESNVTIDVSESYSPAYWTWIVKSWNGSELVSGNMSDTRKEIKIYWSSDMQTYCEYNSTTQSAVCNLTLLIFDSRGYVSSDTEELLIAKKKDVEPELYVKKYVTPDVVQLGQPFELHIRIVGRGFVVERSDLSVVTVIDKSESMHAGNLGEAHTERTKFGEFSYPLNPSVLTANFSVGESHKNENVYVVAYTTEGMQFWDSSATENLPSDVTPNGAFTLYVNGLEVTRGTNVRGQKAPYYGEIRFECNNGIPELYRSNNRIPAYGICYETKASTGNWSISLVVSNPESLNVNILVFLSKNEKNYNNADIVVNQTEQYTPNLIEHRFRFEPGYTKNNYYEFAYVYIPGQYAGKINAWIENVSSGRFSFCQNNTNPSGKVCFIQRVPAGQDIPIYIVPSKIDASRVEGSLWMEKLDAAKIAAIRFVESLNESDYKGLVDFSTCACAYEVNSSPYLKKLTTDSSNVVDKIKNITAEDWTNYLEALDSAGRVLKENETIIGGTKPLIILLSGGKPTCRQVSNNPTCPSGYSCSNSACNPDDCGSQVIPKANELKDTTIGNEYIDICTIGFGERSYYNETILRAVSGRHTPGGVVECYYSAETLQELIEAFQRIGRLYKVAATNVSLNDTIPANLNLYLYPEVMPELKVRGNSSCSLDWSFQSGGTLLNLSCSEIYIDDEIEIVVKLVAQETGLVPINSGGKITFVDVNGNRKSIDLNVIYVNVTKAKGAEVRIS